MSLLAIEWDSRQARIAVGRAQGARLVVEQAFTVELTAGEGSEASSDDRVGNRIGAALAARGISVDSALVAVGRTSIELRPLSLPPVPDDELPMLVRHQAQRQFTTLGENWPLDYVPLPAAPGEPRTVLAAAISPQLVTQIEKTCAAAGVTPSRLVLRPFAAASLVRRQDRTATARVRLFVDLLSEEADLTAMVDKTVVLVRTVRLPGASRSAEQARALVGEIRRTIAAVQHEMGGRRVEQVLICGDGADHAALQAQVQRDLSLKTELFDPFDQVALGEELKKRPLEHTGLFAPLIGMLWDEAQASAPAIDFVNPRKKPEPPSPWRMYSLVGGAAAALVLAVVALVWSDLDASASKLQALKAEGKRQEAQVIAAKQILDRAKKLDEWRAGDVVWLDELADLSSRFPAPAEARVNQLQVVAAAVGGGDVLLEGVAQSSTVIATLEESLHDDAHRVRPLGSKDGGADPKYPWQFREAIAIAPPGTVVAAPPSTTKPPAAPASDPAASTPAKSAVPGGQQP